MTPAPGSRHLVTRAFLFAVNAVLWPYALRTVHPWHLHAAIGIAVGLFVGWGCQALFAMAFVEDNETVSERLKARPLSLALTALWVLGTAAAVVMMVVPMTMQPRKGNDPYARFSTDELMAAACYDQAERRLVADVERDPANPHLRFALSQASLMLGRSAEAEAAAREGVRLAPKSGEGYFHLARALIAAGKPAEALKAAREGVAFEPENLRLRDMEATALTHSGDLVSAEAIYVELIRKEPENPVWLVRRSRALLGLDRFGESRDALDAAIAKARSLADKDPANTGTLEAVMQMSEEIDGLLAQKGAPTKLPAWTGPEIKSKDPVQDHDDNHPPGGEPGGGVPGGPGRPGGGGPGPGTGGEGGARM